LKKNPNNYATLLELTVPKVRFDFNVVNRKFAMNRLEEPN
jgi:hypothetical protein